MVRGVVFLTAVLAAVGPACVEPSAPTPVGRRSLPINGGAPENQYPSTVALLDLNWQGGGLCSGSVIAPRVVISAKHCFEERGNDDPGALADWIVALGPYGDAPDQTFTIQEVLTTPQNEVNNFDIEVVILDDDIRSADQYEIRRDFEGMRVGDGATLVGYGENPTGGLARKYSGESSILGFGPVPESGIGENEFVTFGAAACGGDSGGSVLDGEGRLIGVIVRGAQEDCGSADNQVTAITRIDAFLDVIDEGLQRTGVCVAHGAEVCDGLDNDCDGETDPGCADLFGACERDDLCRTGVCRDVGGGKICTQPCEPAVPVGSCPADTYCREVACGESYCTAGAAGAVRAGDACDGDTDCSTLRCREGVCVAGCVPGEGECQPGEVCAAEGPSCGSCLAAESVAGPRGLGEPCESNADCESDACANVPGDHYCTTRCDGLCPGGYHCADGACLRGDLGEDGEPCEIDAECGVGRCVVWDGGRSCSSTCDPSNACPEGATCQDIDDGGSACRPDKGILGVDCDSGSDCFGDICANWNGGKRCSEACDVADPCPTGFQCVDAGDGVRVCVGAGSGNEGDGDDGGGCGCRVGGGGHAAGAWLLGLVALAASLGRRRRKGCDARRS